MFTADWFHAVLLTSAHSLSLSHMGSSLASAAWKPTGLALTPGLPEENAGGAVLGGAVAEVTRASGTRVALWPRRAGGVVTGRCRTAGAGRSQRKRRGPRRVRDRIGGTRTDKTDKTETGKAGKAEIAHGMVPAAGIPPCSPCHVRATTVTDAWRSSTTTLATSQVPSWERHRRLRWG